MTDAKPIFSLLGTTAALFEAPGPAMDLTRQQRIWALAKETQTWPEVREAVPETNVVNERPRVGVDR